MNDSCYVTFEQKIKLNLRIVFLKDKIRFGKKQWGEYGLTDMWFDVGIALDTENTLFSASVYCLVVRKHEQ